MSIISFLLVVGVGGCVGGEDGGRRGAWAHWRMGEPTELWDFFLPFFLSSFLLFFSSLSSSSGHKVHRVGVGFRRAPIRQCTFTRGSTKQRRAQRTAKDEKTGEKGERNERLFVRSLKSRKELEAYFCSSVFYTYDLPQSFVIVK